MKAGDLVKLDLVNYPRHNKKIGMLIEVPRPKIPNKWAVMIGGKVHPYTVAEEDMEIINEVGS